ncbi:MAG: Uma2 family endonuclease [Pirellulaceae bacterium]
MPNTTDQVTTAEQLAARADDGRRYELVAGVLRMMSPAGNRHGRIAARLLVRIANHVEQHALGETYAAETGFLLERSPDTVRAPDVAFVARGRLEAFADHVGYLPLAPDLVAEVVSPSDSSSDVEAKVQDWLRAGVRIVLAVDPQNSTIREYRGTTQIHVHSSGLLDLDDILPGFQLDVAELFA